MKSEHTFIYGTQILEIEEKALAVRSATAGKGEIEYFRFDAGDFFKQDRSQSLSLLEDFQNSCETVSFFQNPILIEIISLQNIQGKQKKKKDHVDIEAEDENKSALDPGSKFVQLLKDYLENPPGDVRFLLSATIKKTSELKSGLGKVLEKKAQTIKLTVSYDDFNPVGWVIERGKGKGLMFDRYTAGYLIELAGSDLSVLDMELEKLSLLHHEGAHLHYEHLLESVSHSKSFTVFRISQFLAQRDLKNALESLDVVMTGKSGELIGLSGLISSQYRKLLKVAWMQDAGALTKDIEKKMKMTPWLVGEMMKLLKGYTIDELENIIVYWSNLDTQLKYSGVDGVLLLKEAFYRIAAHELKN